MSFPLHEGVSDHVCIDWENSKLRPFCPFELSAILDETLVTAAMANAHMLASCDEL